MKKIIFILSVILFTVKVNAQSNVDADSKLISKTQTEAFKLSQNYPNPAKETTQIKLQINASGSVSMKLYDVLGNPVLSLIDQHLNAGIYSVGIETENMAEGVYFYVIKKDSTSQTMKMIVSK